MRCSLSLLICLLLFPRFAYLQTVAKDGLKSEQIIYEGRIVDKETGEALPFSQITHIYQLDSLIIRNYIADKEGLFKISVPRVMDNRIEIACMGYRILTRILNEAGKGERNKYSTNLTLRSAQDHVYNHVDLGILKLEPDVHTLDEVVVKARLELFRYSGDTLLVFPRNVKQMEGDALVDLLKRHPSFRVTDNGDIYVDGKKIERAMLNNKHIFGEDVKTLVNSIMAKEAGLIKVYDEIDEESEIFHGESEKVRKRKVMNVITFKDFNLFKGGDLAVESGYYLEKDIEGDHPLMRKAMGTIGQYTDKFRISGKGNYNKVYYPQKQKDILLGLNSNISSPDLLKQFNVTYDYKHKKLNETSWTELLYTSTDYFQEQISEVNNQMDNKRKQHLYRIDGQFIKKKKFSMKFVYDGSFSEDNQYTVSVSEIERDGQKLSSVWRKREFANQNYKNHLYFSLTLLPISKLGSANIYLDGYLNKGKGEGIRLDSNFTNGMINNRSYTLTSDRPEARINARISFMGRGSRYLSNRFRIDYGRSGNHNFSVDQHSQLIDSVLSRDQVNKNLLLSYQLGFDIIPNKIGVYLTYTHMEDQMEEHFPLPSFMKKNFNTINYGIEFMGKIFHINYSTSDNRVPVHYFSIRLNDNDPMNLSSGNPNLKMGKTHTVNIQPRTRIKHINHLSVFYKYITNPILFARRYFPEHTSLSEYGNYEVLAGSTLSLPIHSTDYHQFQWQSNFNLIEHGTILWRSGLTYEFENPNIDILGTFWDSKRNTVSGSMRLFSNFSSSLRFDASHNVSYNNLSVSGNSDYDNAIIRHNLKCDTHIHLFGRCFFKANYNYINSYNTRLRRTQQINRLNASLDYRVFSDRKGVISLNAYNVFDSRESIKETVEDLGIRSVYSPSNSTLFTISFRYKFGVEQ